MRILIEKELKVKFVINKQISNAEDLDIDKLIDELFAVVKGFENLLKNKSYKFNIKKEYIVVNGSLYKNIDIYTTNKICYNKNNIDDIKSVLDMINNEIDNVKVVFKNV